MADGFIHQNQCFASYVPIITTLVQLTVVQCFNPKYYDAHAEMYFETCYRYLTTFGELAILKLRLKEYITFVDLFLDLHLFDC